MWIGGAPQKRFCVRNIPELELNKIYHLENLNANYKLIRNTIIQV